MTLVLQFLSRAALFLVLSGALASAANADGMAARLALNDTTGGRAVVTQDANGRVTHLRAATSPIADNRSATPEQRARQFLSSYRDLFLAASTPLEIASARVSPSSIPGASLVRIRQTFNGVPVRGGEAIIHLDARGVTAVTSKLQSDLAAVNTVPALSAEEAQRIAERESARLFPRAVLSFTAPALEIINVGELLQRSNGNTPLRLAWFSDVRGSGIHEFVWIDATTGRLILHFSQIAHAAAQVVNIFDAAGGCEEPSTAAYDSVNLPTIGTDAYSAYTNVTLAYDYFASLGRAGFKGNDSPTAVGIVNLCDTNFSTPVKQVPNAYYETQAAYDLNHMWFAAGMAAANDVVGHEFAHGIIDFANLDSNGDPKGMLNIGQSGALAEGFADVFGEAIDLTSATNGARWAFGENATGGAFRDLMSPNTFNLPGKVTDTKFYCGVDNDVAIHTNGAVLAHAFALLVDGGTYNGYTISSIGITKAARIFYDAMIALPSTASFSDAYLGFKTAAALITGTVITSSDSAELNKVLDAVELDVAPCGTSVNYCPTGFSPVESFADDFDTTNSGKWVNGWDPIGVNHWNGGVGTPAIYYGTQLASDFFGVDPATGTYVGIFPYSGQYALQGDATRGSYGARLGDSWVAMANAVTLPESGDLRMQFEGRFYFEKKYPPDDISGDVIGPDGGVVEYSTDGGTNWINVETATGSLISAGQGYTGIIQIGQGNRIGGEHAFVGSVSSANYLSTQLNLASLAGKSVKFRFRVGTDNSGTNGMGWQIDDVAIYSCTETPVVTPPPTPSSKKKGGGDIGMFALCLLALLLFTHRSFIKSRRAQSPCGDYQSRQ